MQASPGSLQASSSKRCRLALLLLRPIMAIQLFPSVLLLVGMSASQLATWHLGVFAAGQVHVSQTFTMCSAGSFGAGKTLDSHKASCAASVYQSRSWLERGSKHCQKVCAPIADLHSLPAIC